MIEFGSVNLWRRWTGRPDPVVPGRAWNDPALDAVLAALPVLLPEPALEAALAHLGAVRTDVERHVLATEALGAALTGKLDALRPQAGRFAVEDPATEADLLALLGVSLATFAWEVRGMGRGAAVSASTGRRFLGVLADADELLQEALRISPFHPAAATGRLRTARGLGTSESDWWSRFEATRRVRSTLYPAHVSMMTGLCRKWYGSDAQMLDFARTVTAAAPAGDPVVALLPAAHSEYLCSVSMFPAESGSDRALAEAYRADLPAVAEASVRWCGADGPPAHARDVEAHQMFGWYLERSAEHQEQARRHLELAGPRMSFLPWAYLHPTPEAAFRAARARLRVS